MKPISILLLAAVGGCSAQPSVPLRLAASRGGAPVNCIDLKQVAGRRVLAPSALLFDMAGGHSYRNDLQGNCAGAARADPTAIIASVSQSTQLCRNDRIRIYDPVEAQATGAGAFPVCRLGSFTPVPAQ